MLFTPVTPENRAAINGFIAAHWFTTEMIIRGEVVDMTAVDGIAVFEDDEIVGLITYRIDGATCEITSFDSLHEGRGVGTELIERVADIARGHGCERLIAVTTNDNINALRFYQRRGFDMASFRRNALDESRRLKPSIPLAGEHGIPLRHEIEFELTL